MERKTRLRIALSLGSLALTFAALEVTGRVVVPAPVERKDGFETTINWDGYCQRASRWSGREASPGQ